MTDLDVIVVGAGNAALCAALAAAETGAKVTVLERAPGAEAGGNSRFTAGAFRCVYDGVDDLRALMPDLTDAEVESADFGTYTEAQFFDDMGRVTEYRTDPELCELLVTRSRPTMRWMQGRGLRFMPIWGRQAYRIGGRFKFWGGLTVEAWGGGPGLVETLYALARAAGVEIAFGAHVTALLADDDGVHGLRMRQGGRTSELRARAVVLACGGFESNPEWRTRYLGPGWDLAKVRGTRFNTGDGIRRMRQGGRTSELRARAVVLACGGFESNPEWRTRYLGPGWDLAKVRGTRFNTGDGIRMALDIGAAPYGNWSGCHAVGWDRNAPEFGDLAVGDGFQKHSYPLGVMLNARGERFVDEGADFRNYTYAKYGRAILAQPGQFAWQVFDARTTPLLRDEYRIRQATRVRADTLEGLAAALEDVDAAGALATLKAFNAAVMTNVTFDPNVKDGRGTAGLATPKSNWANPIDAPPFEAFAVTCGVTFTFGGLRIDAEGRVVDTDGAVIPGLHAAGELVGGLFYNNYPGGSGLMAGAVFGRIAGTSAGAFARRA